MKTLKFYPELVPLVLNGSKTSTWRLWDDKNLQVGDHLVFIDRSNSTSFANAEIIKIIEKPIGQMTEDDKKGHEEFTSDEAMYKTFSGYYQREVKPDTPIKIIHFKLI